VNVNREGAVILQERIERVARAMGMTWRLVACS
jgi:hypothetical protein